MKDKANKVKVWIARDKNGSLYAFSNPPIKCTDHHWGFSTCFILDESIFPSVKWEDDKPTEAYITLDEPQEQPKQEHPKQEIDWEQRRYEIAKDILIKTYFNEKNKLPLLYDSDIHSAISYANKIIEKLKEKTNEL